MKQKQLNEIKCIEYFMLPKDKYNGFGVYDKKIIINEENREIYLNNGIEIVSAIIGEKYITPEEAIIKYESEGKKEFILKNFEDVKRLFRLLEGLRWRGIHIMMYQEGILDGSVPYITLLGFDDKNKIPEYVMKYLSKMMFNGNDKELIESLYYNNGELNFEDIDKRLKDKNGKYELL